MKNIADLQNIITQIAQCKLGMWKAETIQDPYYRQDLLSYYNYQLQDLESKKSLTISSIAHEKQKSE